MNDEMHMGRAIELAATVRAETSPNPWVGCVVVAPGEERRAEGATAPPGGPHAEVRALSAATDPGQWTGATLYSTLEPCAHHGRTPPCTDAIVSAGVTRVVVGMLDPDPLVSGRGVAALEAAGIEVMVGVCADEVAEQLAPYLKHRRTGRPLVVLKLASTLDGRTAAPDGSSRWITSAAARRDAHLLRARSDAVVVGAGTVRTDDPALTVRLDDADDADDAAEASDATAGGGGVTPPGRRQPLRVVLGTAPAAARVRPALELSGDLAGVLDELGGRGVLQVLVEGGASVAHDFHAAGLVDRYVLYVAPALMGGDDGRPLFAGAGAATIDEVWRGTLISVERLGEDLRVEVAA